MRIKVCGLNPVRDVQICIDLGVNFLGFVFYEKSPRNLKNLEDVQKLKRYNKKNSFFAAVTVNPTNEFIKKVILENFDYIQLHGSETVERVKEIKSMGLKIIKAIKIKEESDIEHYKKYNHADIIENIAKLGVTFCDLSSSLELDTQIGYKDHSKIKKFIKKINEIKN